MQHGKSGVVMARSSEARPVLYWHGDQWKAREGQIRPRRMAERPVVVRKPGNAGGAKGPWFDWNGESFDFLGYTVGRCYSGKTNRAYLGTRPSSKAMRRVRQKVHERTRRCRTSAATAGVVQELNRILIGWSNYFCLGTVYRSYRSIDQYVEDRLRWWLCRKHKRPWRDCRMFPRARLHGDMGLVRLTQRTKRFPWAKA